MEVKDIITILEKIGVIQKGHFLLSSGKHSDTYMQCSKLLEYPEKFSFFVQLLIEKITHENIPIDRILSPALGGVVIGYEVARQLNKPFIFCERVDNIFTLRRGFDFFENDNILLVEDVITTGKSSIEAYHAVENTRDYSFNLVGCASLINRSGKNSLEYELNISNSEAEIKQNAKIMSLLSMDLNLYDDRNLPDALAKIPVTKPGSRKILNFE